MSKQEIKHEFSQQQLISLIASCYRLINTAYSPSFRKSLNKQWIPLNPSETSYAVNIKANQNYELLTSRLITNTQKESITSYLDALAQENDIKVKKSECKGLVRSLDLGDHNQISEFIQIFSIGRHQEYSYRVGRFAFHEIVFALMDYLLIKQTLSTSLDETYYAKALKHLLETKPAGFFSNGYINDFFVHDQKNALSNLSRKPMHITTKTNYLSTWTLDDADRKNSNKDLKGLDVLRIA